MATKRIFAALLFLSLPGGVNAQGNETAKLLYACYIPQSGVVYRVGEPGLRNETPACVSLSHVLFSWNERGERGDKGDRGDPGQPGNLALAGQVCPTGQSVVGFSVVGTLLCSAGGAPPPPPPPPPPASTFDGTWTFAPTLSMSCPGRVLSMGIRIDGARTRLTAPGVLTVTLLGSFIVSGIVSVPIEPEVDVQMDEAAGTFSGTGTISFHEANDLMELNASGTVNMNGAFGGSNSFTTSVAATLTLDFARMFLLGPETRTCDPMNTTVTGSRTGT